MTQSEALEILKTGANVFLSGEPGSGKTHIINEYVEYLRDCGIEPAITASTGIAATHLGGMTVHSWSGIGIKKDLSPYEVEEIAGRERLVRRIGPVNTLIIDEISMLDNRTLDSVDAVLRVIKRTEAPFGGMQIVFVGDFFQLPPVARYGEEQPKFAFESKSWVSAKPIVCYLSEQHRQEDAKFLEVLSAIRRSSVSLVHKERLHSRKAALAGGAHDGITKLFPHNADVDRLNDAELSKLPGEPRKFEMEWHGPSALVEQLKRGCLSPEKLELKIGAKVMFTKNNFDNGFVNGTTGEVMGFDKTTGAPAVKTRAGRIIAAETMEWVIEDGGKILARIIQVPLRLAWAITVHKSQGMSLDAAFIDLSQAFEYGQGYVALSRVRTLSGLYLGGLNDRALLVHREVLMEDERFRVKSDEAREGFGALGKDELKEMHNNFIRASGGKTREEGGRRKVRGAAAKVGGKGERLNATLEIIKSGKSITEAARERGLTEGTILKHLEDLRKAGKLNRNDIEHLFDGKKKHLAEIHGAFRLLGFEKMKPVFEHLGGRFPYETLRLAHLIYESVE